MCSSDLYSAVLDITLRNCIYENVSGESLNIKTISKSGGSITLDSDYSDFHNVTNSSLGSNDIILDPLLVDGANDNFELRPTSPCLGTGILL